jgi:hypothetical protein
LLFMSSVSFNIFLIIVYYIDRRKKIRPLDFSISSREIASHPPQATAKN